MSDVRGLHEEEHHVDALGFVPTDRVDTTVGPADDRGVTIDELTKKQLEYLSSWEQGT